MEAFNRARKTDPADISVPPGFKVDVFARGLTAPIGIIFADDGGMLVADAGISSGSGKILKLKDGKIEIAAQGITPPLTGITYYKGDIYAAAKGSVVVIKPDGKMTYVLSGLPSLGDHQNNQVVFGPDEKMYFGQGTATNSGVVGEDNAGWVKKYPFFHDYPGKTIELTGQNFVSDHILTNSGYALTGAFSPFDVSTKPHEKVKGMVRASGSILRANPDGSDLELVAWGLRNPFKLRFDRHGWLVCANHGMDERGSRHVANAPDELHFIRPGTWYGWPDYAGGLPVTDPVFKPDGHPQPAFLLSSHPNVPPKPFVSFTPHAAITGFDFNPYPEFGPVGDIFIAEFGSGAPVTTGGKPLPDVGRRVSRIDMQTGRETTFAINKKGPAASSANGGGFQRPTDVLFGDNGEMYVADFGSSEGGMPGTGVIWRITKS